MIYGLFELYYVQLFLRITDTVSKHRVDQAQQLGATGDYSCLVGEAAVFVV